MLSLLAAAIWSPAQSSTALPSSRFAPYEHGFTIDSGALRAESKDAHSAFGGQTTIVLNQAAPTSILVSGLSRAQDVAGLDNSDYAIYIDALYTDGKPLWGLATPFSVGSHDWERQEVLVAPDRPLKSITIYALFRNHAGTAWFKDFKAQTLDGEKLFDGRFQNPPEVPPGKPRLRLPLGGRLNLEIGEQGQLLTSTNRGGFFTRELGKESRFLKGRVHPAANGGALIEGEDAAFRWRSDLKRTNRGIDVEFDLQALNHPTGTPKLDQNRPTNGAPAQNRSLGLNRDRAVTVYLAIPIDATGWRWGRDIRRSDVIKSSQEYSGYTTISAGSTGAMSLYPIACISNGQEGIVIGNSMREPSIYRLFYSGPRKQLVIAWDIAFTDKANPRVAQEAKLHCWIDGLSKEEANWDFRAAATRLYAHEPEAFKRRSKTEGIWMPFTSPATIERPEDFHIAFHEGDNSVAADDKLGIQSFRYTEPMSNWMPMAKNEPRTYENAIRILKLNAESKDAATRDPARATLTSGAQDRNGRLNVEFRNEPWCDGALFVLDPNPALPAKPDWPTKATLNYTSALADREYASKTSGLDGEYLDSLESWSGTLDYRPQDLRASACNLTFDRAGRPVVPQWFSTFAFTRSLSDDLHRRNRLLMANTTPVQFSVFAGLLDVMGIETDWLASDGTWQPLDDATFCFRRTMCDQRPYLLLQNTNFDRFTADHVRRYFQRCAAYGVFPSMFSADAASHPYWEDPKLYNRDRPLFKEWIPIIANLSQAGWQPITHARCSDPQVYVERFGAKYLTLFNDSTQPKTIHLTIDAKALGCTGKSLKDREGRALGSKTQGATITLDINLDPEECQIIEAKD